ncbi:HTH domain-containing protein [Paenibacillus sophorae]|uniref:HTH domain-containing protein n=1 Tax=Paenibacillus sophorae TaxID=1333845 RepID=A0A1H8LAY2_9BACL|nr:HTH domain-containing protein [Paenibacillus sophorae]QWU17355.1 HTH domain-containing protein [Paenibacillus sophorae]SEO02243.1 HTH domain-containing protein [Paenibacillus sophorae]
MPEGSYPFPTYSGLLEPRHYKQIGSAIWLFLWCISSTTAEKEKEGTVWGIVLGNKPIRINELEETFGVSNRTVRSWIKTLEDYGYIRVTRAPYGLIFSVRNSKKYQNRSAENFRSDDGERQNIATLDGSDRQNIADHAAENCRSNKDITEIYKAASSASSDDRILDSVSQVERHFCLRRGKGFSVSPSDFSEIRRMIVDGLPVELINRVIDESFDSYKPKHKLDEIRSITYCIPRCYDEWMKLQQEEPITGAVPHVPVTIGSPQPQRKTKRQREFEELDRFIEEEKRRGNG